MRSLTRSFAVSAAFVAAVLLATAASAAGLPVEDAGISPDRFEPSQACGCHATLVEQWSKSMHAQALTDPLYNAKLDEAIEATDGELGPFCKKCHGPAAAMTGEFTKGGELSPGTAEGVSCSFCHQVSGMAKGEVGNVSQLVEPIGVRRAQLKDPQAPHPAVYSELHEKAEICGGCHNVNHPINGMHLESTYREWSESPYAKEGTVCQDCHMSKQPGVIGPSTGQAAGGAPERDNIYQMTFVGGNVALGPADTATKRLQSAATIKLEISEIVASGEAATATVTITNSGAGHYLPTGLTEVRQMWLEVTATDASGKTTKIGEHIFGTILEDDKGNAPVELWEATKIKSDDRIPPRESVSDAYEFKMPAGVENSTVKAALLYRSAPEELATKAGVDVPTTEMAMAEQAVYSSPEAKANAAKLAVEEPSGGRSPGRSSMAWIVIGALAVVAAVGGLLWTRSRKAA